MAEVTGVSERWEGGGRKGRSHIVYDVVYLYHVNDESYTGEITGTRSHYEVDDRFDVKYDPEHPEISTDVLDVRTDALIMNLVGAGVFAFVGLWLLVVRRWLSRLLGRLKKRDGGEQLPPADG